MTTEHAHPFIKWAGGKRQLLKELLKYRPKQIKTYYEPFVGGGALFWALANRGAFGTAVLNDANVELMAAYRCIATHLDELVPKLAALRDLYGQNPEGTFATVREQTPGNELDRAARFLFLNRTAFNGLYRVNKDGRFNAPWGKYENPPILDEPKLRACSAKLAGVSLCNGDYGATLSGVGPGDFVYFDPPYLPLSATANFTAYTADGFGYADHVKLADHARACVAAGATVVASNADLKIVRDLYKGFRVHRVDATRRINSKGSDRGPVGELVIVGRPK